MDVKLLRIVPAVLIVAALVSFSPDFLHAQGHPCGDGAIPYTGEWTTVDEEIDGGRISEAYCLDPFEPGVPGNKLNAMSWDEVALGLQWYFWGMSIDENGAVETGRDINEYGFGYIDYTTEYEGGWFWLTGAHAWSDGTDLTGWVVGCNVGARVTIAGGVPVGLTSNITLTGVFEQCEECTIKIIANSQKIWQTGQGAMPSDYPPFLCGASSGELHDMCCISAQIICPVVATEPFTWGAIKGLYR
jgi:hypothetical protein